MIGVGVDLQCLFRLDETDNRYKFGPIPSASVHVNKEYEPESLLVSFHSVCGTRNRPLIGKQSALSKCKMMYGDILWSNQQGSECEPLVSCATPISVRNFCDACIPIDSWNGTGVISLNDLLHRRSVSHIHGSVWLFSNWTDLVWASLHEVSKLRAEKVVWSDWSVWQFRGEFSPRRLGYILGLLRHLVSHVHFCLDVGLRDTGTEFTLLRDKGHGIGIG